jgi:hypothetical protein
MLVTWPTSHALRSSSNVDLHADGRRSRSFSISVTALTSHDEIGPCVACAAATSAHHSPSPASRLALSLNADAGDAGGGGGDAGGGSPSCGSRRRSRAPSTASVIGDSCGSPVIASIVDPCGSPVIAIAISGASSLRGSVQPLAVESMARRTSTRPIVLGEEGVPRKPRIASATGTAATVASRVPRSFGYAPRPFEGGAKALLASCAATG